MTVDEDLPVKVYIDVGRVSGRRNPLWRQHVARRWSGSFRKDLREIQTSARDPGFAVNDGQTLSAVERDGCHVLGFGDVNCCGNGEKSWTIGGNNCRRGWNTFL